MPSTANWLQDIGGATDKHLWGHFLFSYRPKVCKVAVTPKSSKLTLDI